MRVLTRWLLIVVVIMLMVASARQSAAANAAPSLILWIADEATKGYWEPSGDLWLYSDADGALRPLTTNAHLTFPVLSPDGTKIAAVAFDKLVLEETKRVGEEPGSYGPSNILVIDRATGAISVVAGQRPDATYRILRSEAEANVYHIRSAPAWSPDGARLAWTEVFIRSEISMVAGDSAPPYLVVCEVQCEYPVVGPSNFPRQAFSVPLPVIWGEAGIAVLSHDFNYQASGRGASFQTVLTYSDSVSPRWRAFAVMNGPKNMIWVHVGKRDYVSVSEYCMAGFRDCECIGSYWALIDPASGAVSCMPGAPELYGVTAPQGVSAANLDPAKPVRWRITWSNQRQMILDSLPFPYDLPNPIIAIAPDGQQIAYADNKGQAFLMDGTRTVSIRAPRAVLGVFWSPMAWRVRYTAG